MRTFLLLTSLFFSTFALAEISIGNTGPNHALNFVDHTTGKINKGLILQRNGQNKFILMEFSTTWCPSCKENLPIMAKLSGDLKSNTITRKVYIEKDVQKVVQYIRDNQNLIPFQAFIDHERRAWANYSTGYIPTTYLIDANDVVLFRFVGVLKEQQIKEIRELTGN